MQTAQRHRKNGRPTKRTKAVLKPLFEAIRIGVPYKLACMAAGISFECFSKWRQKDPAFDAEVEQAAAEPAVKLFNTIREQAPETWQAGAWALERRYPEQFAKPEAQLQLNVLAQAAVQNGNGTAHNVQLVVVSDLEFVGLKRHPAYTHRPGEVREVEQVPPELAGTLERENQNIIVSSESAAGARAERSAEIRARSLEMVEARAGSLYRADKNIAVVSESTAEAQKRRLADARQRLEARHKTISNDSAPREPLPAAEPAAPGNGAPAGEPLPTRPASWWSQFVYPVLGKPCNRSDAVQALKLVLAELRIAADDRLLNFQTDLIAQSVFCQTLAKLTGSDLGWRTLLQIYERQQARERLRAGQ